MAGPRLINSGRHAVEIAATILKTARPIVLYSSLGPVELKPGTIWSGNRMLVDPSPMSVYYMIDDRFYEWGTSDFIRDEWFNALSRGAQSAKIWITVAKTEMALLCGIFVPWYLLLGLSCAKCGIFYLNNKAAVDKAMEVAPKVLEQLQRMREKYPVFFAKLKSQATREILAELGNGVRADDVAFFIGRVIRGAANAPELTIGVLLGIVSKVAVLVTATHAPSVIAHAAEAALHKRAEEFRAYLSSLGYTVSSAEAAQIMRELASDPEALTNLQKMETALRALLPSLEMLKKAYGAL